MNEPTAEAFWRGPVARAVVPLFFLFLAGFVVLNNTMDWDQFYAAAHADVRAWLVEHRLPLWTYQICAGVTRAGDPQAFGLSPFVLFFLLFGPVWGSKLYFLGAAAIGYYYHRRLLVRFAGQEREDDFLLTLSSLCFIGGNYFLSHAVQGHAAFGTVYVALGTIYYTLEAGTRRLSRGEWWCAALLTWANYTAGAYSAIVFFLLPFYFAYGAFLLLAFPAWAPPSLKGSYSKYFMSLWRSVSFHLFGILLAAYKLLFVLRYQHLFPRTIIDATEERGHLWDPLVAQMVPLLRGLFPGRLRPYAFGPDFISTSFSWLPWMLIAYFGLQRAGRGFRGRFEELFEAIRSSRFFLFLALYGLVLLLFVLGNAFPWTLHVAFNRLVFHNSVRNLERYEVGYTLLLSFLVARAIGHSDEFRAWLRGTPSIVFLMLLGLNFFSFRGALFSEWKMPFVAWSESYPERMNEVVFTDYDPEARGSLPLLRAGKAIIDCYNPLAKPHVIDEPLRAAIHEGRLKAPVTFPLVDPDIGRPSSRCVAGSYFTSQQIVLDPSCPAVTCVNLNGINPWQKSPHFALSQKYGKYCTEGTASVETVSSLSPPQN